MCSLLTGDLMAGPCWQAAVVAARLCAKRRKEVRGSVLTFSGDCAGSFTMSWKLNTVCDIYSPWHSLCITKIWNEQGWKLEEQVATLNSSKASHLPSVCSSVHLKFWILPRRLCQPMILYLIYYRYSGPFTEMLSDQRNATDVQIVIKSLSCKNKATAQPLLVIVHHQVCTSLFPGFSPVCPSVYTDGQIFLKKVAQMK